MRGTLYQHFPSRETLLRELLSSALDRPRARARAAAALEGPLAERLIGVLDSYIGMAYSWAYQSQPGANFLNAMESFGNDLVEAETRRHRRLLAAVLRSAHGKDEIDLDHAGWSASELAEMLHGAAHGVATSRGELIAPARMRRRLRFVVDGFIAQLQPKGH